jgi:hypothetical protein
MDETDSPQTPDGLIVILAAIADEGIPIQTNCTEVHRAFNKGVDYEGDLDKFKQRIFERRRYPGVCGGRVRTADNLKLSGRALPGSLLPGVVQHSFADRSRFDSFRVKTSSAGTYSFPLLTTLPLWGPPLRNRPVLPLI